MSTPAKVVNPHFMKESRRPRGGDTNSQTAAKKLTDDDRRAVAIKLTSHILTGWGYTVFEMSDLVEALGALGLMPDEWYKQMALLRDAKKGQRDPLGRFKVGK